jgi:hypothetical protein
MKKSRLWTLTKNYAGINKSDVATWLWCCDSWRRIETQHVKKGGSSTKVQISFTSLLSIGTWRWKVWRKTQIFELLIHYVVEQKATTQGIRMSKGVESVFVTWQEIVVLPRAELIVAKGVHVVVRVRYSEPKFN